MFTVLILCFLHSIKICCIQCPFKIHYFIRKKLDTTKKEIMLRARRRPMRKVTSRTTKQAPLSTSTTKKKANTLKKVRSANITKSKRSTKSEDALQGYLQHVQKFKSVKRTDADLKSVALGCGQSHAHLQCQVMKDFVVCLTSYGEKWKPLLCLSSFTDVGGNVVKIPLIIKTLGGEVTSKKVCLANDACIDWQGITKKKSTGKESKDCPWFQPVTQSQRLRTFFAKMQKCYHWQLTIEHFKGPHQIGPFLL